MLDNKIKKITSPINDELECFELKLKELISKEDNFLKNDIDTFLFSSPKRLRVILIYLFSKILNIKDEKTVLDIALATELIHSASLIHDDIIDKSINRRNLTTFHKKHNSTTAVLAGDFLLAIALDRLSNTNVQIIKIFSDKIKDTINGELDQNQHIGKITTIDEYLKKTYQKTGNLFIAGLDALLTLDNFDKKLSDQLINYTKNFSIGFQLKNDIKDYKSDIKNGNYTLIMLYFLKEHSIKELNNNTNLNKYISLAKNKMEEYKNNAIKSLVGIEQTIHQKALIELCNELTGNL